MAATIIINVTNSGGNIILDGSQFPSNEVTVEIFSDGATLTNNFHIEVDPAPADGTIINWLVVLNNPFNLNGNTFDVSGAFFTQDLIDKYVPYYARTYYVGALGGTTWSADSLFYGYLNPSLLPDAELSLDKLENLSRGNILVGNSSNRPSALDANDSGKILIGDGTDLNSVAVTGDITINSSGVTAIGSGVIVNADINASAAITRSKIASGTASHVIINDGSGVLSSEAQLANTRGGTGINTSSSTGFPTINSGTWSVSPLTDSLRCDISFVTAAQGTYYIRVPYACTVTSAKARVTSTISGTDDGTITFKDNSGTNMTGGLITIPASSVHGTGVTCTMTANNTFTANQEIQLLVSKVTSGGLCSVDITITRNS